MVGDDVKAAIAGALDEQFGMTVHIGGAVRVIDRNTEVRLVAEAAHDAAVEAGMAPAAEVERLREQMSDECRYRDERIARLHAERDRYREALEPLVSLIDRAVKMLNPDPDAVTVEADTEVLLSLVVEALDARAGKARAALDGDDQHEHETCPVCASCHSTAHEVCGNCGVRHPRMSECPPEHGRAALDGDR